MRPPFVINLKHVSRTLDFFLTTNAGLYLALNGCVVSSQTRLTVILIKHGNSPFRSGFFPLCSDGRLSYWQ